MVLVHVRVAGGEEGFQFAGVHLPEVLGECQYFVSRILHGTGLVNADMAGFYGHGTLVVMQHGRNDRRIGLGAADQEVDLAVRAGACLQDLPLGAFCVRVAPVAVQLLEIGFREPLQDFRMGPFRIVASEKDHNYLCLSANSCSISSTVQPMDSNRTSRW